MKYVNASVKIFISAKKNIVGFHPNVFVKMVRIEKVLLMNQWWCVMNL